MPTLTDRLLSALGALVEDSAPQPRVDNGWYNAITGMGVDGVDKTIQTTYEAPCALTRYTLESLYRHHGIAKKIIRRRVFDSLREGWEINTEEQPELAKAITAELSRLEVRKVYGQARDWARLYGAALVVIGYDDVAFLDDPSDGLEGERQQYTSVTRLRAVPAGLSGPVNVERDEHNQPLMYVLNPHGKLRHRARVHPSRVWVVEGEPLPPELLQRNDWWPDSTLQSVWDSLATVGTADKAGVTYLTERSKTKWYVKGLKALAASQTNAESSIKTRIRSALYYLGQTNSLILDKDHEEVVTDTMAAAGIAELLDIYPNRVAASSGYPLTLLYGVSPGGLNATGESDIRMYYDEVSSMEQTDHLQPFLERVIDDVLMSAAGPTRGNAAEYSIQFRPLWAPSAQERATTKKTNAETDAVYIREGVLDASEVAQSRFGGAEYGEEIQLNEDLRDEFGDLEAGEVPPELAQGMFGMPPQDTDTDEEDDET